MRILKLTVGAVVACTALVAPDPTVSAPKPQCAADNAGLTLPPGFCALIVAEGAPRPRHIVVAPNGDVLVGLSGNGGGVLALRDTNGDGTADIRQRIDSGVGPTTGIALADGYLYYSPNTAVIRVPWHVGDLKASGPADTIVKELPASPGHSAKSIAVSGSSVYVNIGSPSNSCQAADRQSESPGKDPCTERDTRAGIWKFDVTKKGQREADGTRFSAGIRNTVALALRTQDGQIYGVAHGRDQLSQNWPKYFNDTQSAEKPSEIFLRFAAGADFGWPYCYHDLEQGKTVMAPEYGGDGHNVGRCATVTPPMLAFPGHWAPDGLTFAAGTQFPVKYRNGAFIAFHGSWNRAPAPQAGYKIVFVPFNGNAPAGTYETFADGFAGVSPVAAPTDAVHRPTGITVGPDGSLYVTDDTPRGRIYRILYRGQ
jgi:glucose/arabinose dehydrogenase